MLLESQIVPFEELRGKTFLSVAQSNDKEEGSDIIRFVNENGLYVLGHSQDCCETVLLVDVCGDLEDLEEAEILLASEVSNTDGPKLQDHPRIVEPDEYSHWTWTFYNMSTMKGTVTLRWYGASNGYYSEKVGLYKL